MIKRLKKLGLYLLAPFALLLAVALLPNQTARAATPANQAQLNGCINNLRFVNIANISCVVNGSTITFTDSNPTDDTPNYAPPSGVFCSVEDLVYTGGTLLEGITLEGKVQASDASKSSIKARIHLGYQESNDCVKVSSLRPIAARGGGSILNAKEVTITQGISKLATYLTWESGIIKPLSGVTSGSLSLDTGTGVSDGYISFSRAKVSLDPSNGHFLYLSDNFSTSKCQGGVIVIANKNGAPSVVAEYGIGKSGTTASSSSYPDLFPLLSTGQGCKIAHTNFGLKGNFNIGGVAPSLSTIKQGGAGSTEPVDSVGGGAVGGGTVDNDSETTCQTSFLGASGHQISWLLCPMMAAAQSASEALTNLIENLLSFSVRGSLNGSGAEKAWANIRNISSILLVVIMLIMVLSQAVSWGPFDAYTVRKVLPKLVVAVIAMQLSWSLLTYVFDLFNHIGRGVADLLYQPFGGPEGVTLGKALAKSGIDTATASTINWVALGGVAALAVLSLPTLVIAVWAVVVALLTGFIVLVFRQILLIACLIFAPLAILAWILPNTNRYWKLWYDNFTKLLLMFPMIMGLLAAGKIFAIITGDSSSAGPAGTMLRFIFVVVGFYGPYFLLPKTYKWGGAAMSLASQGISKAATSGTGPVSNYLKGRQERSRWNLSRQQRKAELMRRAQSGWAEGMSSSGLWGLQGRVNRARTAGLSSLVRSRVDRETRGRIAQSALAQREKVLKEQADETLAPLVEAGNWTGIESLARTGTSHEREAAIAQIITSRRWEEAARLRADPTTEADWTRTLAKNGDLVGTLDEKRADLLAGPSRPIMRVIAGGDVAIDRTTGQPRLDPVTHQPIINSGLTPAQLVQQHATFWTAAGRSIGAASDDEVRGTYERMELMARDPRALQLVGGAGEAGANLVLNEYRQRFGAGAGSLRDLIEAQRMPPPTSSAPPAPPAGGGGTFTPRSGSTSTPI